MSKLTNSINHRKSKRVQANTEYQRSLRLDNLSKAVMLAETMRRTHPNVIGHAKYLMGIKDGS